MIWILANLSTLPIILLEWDNLEKAKEYIQSEYVKNIMVEAGNIGTPEDILIELVEKVKF